MSKWAAFWSRFGCSSALRCSNLRRMIVVLSANSFMFRCVCMVRKTEWMLCGSFRANISARPFQLYPNVFAKFLNPKFKFLMKFIKDFPCNSEIWLHFKKKLCLQFVRQTNTYSPEIPLRKPFNWLPASLFPWVSNLTECSTIPALKNIFFFGIENHGVLHTSLIVRLRSIFLGIKAE